STMPKQQRKNITNYNKNYGSRKPISSNSYKNNRKNISQSSKFDTRYDGNKNPKYNNNNDIRKNKIDNKSSKKINNEFSSRLFDPNKDDPYKVKNKLNIKPDSQPYIDPSVLLY